MKIYKRSLGLFSILMLSAATVVAVPAQAANKTVKFTVFPAVTASNGVYVADALGFFEKNGVTIQYVNAATGTSALQTLLAGSTDFIITDLTGAANAIKAGADIGFVSGQFQYFHGALYCQKEISAAGGWPTNMKNLVGKRIGITGVGAATDTYTRYSLLKAGVDPKSVTIVPIGGAPSLVAAFLAKSVDCVTAFQPMQAQLKDASVMVNWEKGEGPKEFTNYMFNGIATTRTFANANQATVKAVAQAMKDASNYANEAKNAGTIAEKILKFYPGLALADMKQIIESTSQTHSYKINSASILNAARVYRAVVGTWPVKNNTALVLPGVRRIVLQ